jgi:hypothetical protein
MPTRAFRTRRVIPVPMRELRSPNITAVRKFVKWWPAWAAFLIFLCQGSLVLSYPGLQNDELLFAEPIYQVAGLHWAPRIFRHAVPVMLESYLGALKTWVYWPLLAIGKPSVQSIRWPVLLLSATSLCILFRFVELVHSRWAAAAAVMLAATDPCYILTGCFDWGPVVVQHFLLATAAVAAFQHVRTGRERDLAISAFCAGLALWDKALFVWPAVGIAAGLTVAFAGPLRRAITRRRLAVGAAAFAVGAAPFLCYNVTHRGASFRANAGLTLSEFGTKFAVLRSTANGSGLFGYLVQEDDAPSPKAPGNWAERDSAWIRGWAGEWRSDGRDWVEAAALALFPLAWISGARRLLGCLWVAIGVGWLQMVITREAGGSVHHAILLWPMPAVAVGVMLAEGAARLRPWGGRAAAVALAAMMAAGLLTFNQYLYQFGRDGAGGSWSDAVTRVAEAAPGWGARAIYAGDWGVKPALVVMGRGRTPVRWAAAWLMSDDPGPAGRAQALAGIADAEGAWVQFTDGNEQFNGVNARLERMAREAGFEKEPIAIYKDCNGRPMIQAFRFRRRAGAEGD